jgi:DNA-directed RNA polymerase beta' subunit
LEITNRKIRSIVEKKSDTIPGEDAMLARELLKLLKKNILIGGVEGIQKCFLSENKEKKEWIIETEGTNLLEILGNIYVDSTRTYTNDLNEIEIVLGREV